MNFFSCNPGKEIAGYINLKQVYEIAKIKIQDEHLKHIPLRSMASQVF